jgi:hypothetical protein
MRALWLGVVGQAVRDLLYPEIEHSTVEDRETAYDWLMSDAEGVYTYLWVCDIADVHPDVARRRLRDAGIL